MPFDAKIPGWIADNWRTKVIAALLAVITWYTIDDTISNTEVIPDIPLIIRPGDRVAVLSRSVDKLDVTFRGAREDIQKLARDDITVEITPPGTAGVSRIVLKPDDVKFAGGCRVVSLDPDTVDIILDREGEKMVTVRAATEDALPDGYVLDKLTCAPTNVTIYGPVSQIENIEVIRTRPLSLKGRNGTFRERIALAAPSDIWVARMEPEKVMVEAVIVEHTDEKTIEAVPVAAMVGSGMKHAVRINPANVNITVKGGEAVLKQTDVTRISAYVDCSGLMPGSTFVLPVKVIAGPEIVVDRVEPDVVDVEMSAR